MSLINISLASRPTSHMPNPHEHEFYELYFLIDGYKNYIIESKFQYKLEPNCITVVPPHSMHLTTGGAFTRMLIEVYPEFISAYEIKVLNKIIDNKAIQLDDESFHKIIEICNKMITISKEKEEFAEYKLKCLFSYIILLLDERIYTSPTISFTKIYSPAYLHDLINYIQTNIASDLSLLELSKIFHYSTSTISKHFVKYIGLPLSQYILNLRMERAKYYLVTTKYSIEKISEICGFSSSNYFCLIFKKKAKSPPLTYRKTHLPPPQKGFKHDE